MSSLAASVTETAAAHAAEVDAQARFPKETVDALRAEGRLGVLVPTELGGPGSDFGADLETAMDDVRALARRCGSSAMILAMRAMPTTPAGSWAASRRSPDGARAAAKRLAVVVTICGRSPFRMCGRERWRRSM